MVKKNRMDLITDLVKERVSSIYDEIHNQYGGSNPYRQEPVSRKEIMLDFDDMMSREPQLRQQFGDEMVNSYKQNMLAKLGGK